MRTISNGERVGKTNFILIKVNELHFPAEEKTKQKLFQLRLLYPLKHPSSFVVAFVSLTPFCFLT